MNIFEALRESHDTQRTLLDKLVQTEGDSEDRRNLWDQLKAELENHADAEERHFYVPLMQHDQTQDKSRHSVAEHNEMDEIIEELDDMEMSSPGWLTRAKTLKEKVEHHLDEEEHEVFQQAGKVLSDGEKTSLAQDYRRRMSELES